MALFLVKVSFFKGSRPGLGSAFEPPLLRGGGTRSVTEGFGSFAAAQGNALRGANAIIFGELKIQLLVSLYLLYLLYFHNESSLFLQATTRRSSR